MNEIYVTNEQIQALKREAQEHGDDVQAVVCMLAIELDADTSLGPNGFEERVGGGGLRLSPRDRSRLASMTGSAAWDECARAIGAAAREARS